MNYRVLFRKDPDSVFPYQVDWSQVLADLGDTIESVEFAVVDIDGEEVAETDLVIEGHTVTASGVVTFWLSGGSANPDGTTKRYFVRVRITCANTNPVQTIDDETVCIPVGHR